MVSAGGFVPCSPPPSVIASSSISRAVPLPRPRNSPLRPGGTKESAFIRHVDQRILGIQRRFAKRTRSGRAESTAQESRPTDYGPSERWVGQQDDGYVSMKQACRDISEVVDVVWVSGTPSLQVPYIIGLALLLSTVITAMPLEPKSLFRCLGKVDHCFASLVQGTDVETGEMLPGYADMGSKRGANGTEKVRIRSLVERTRVSVFEAFKKGEFEDEVPGEDGSAVETHTDMEGGLEGRFVLDGQDHREFAADEAEEDNWDMQLARVYDRTIQELGDTLEHPGIGMLKDIGA